MKNRQKHTLGQIFAEELYRNAPKVSKAQAKKQAHIAQMQYRSSRCTNPALSCLPVYWRCCCPQPVLP